MVKIRVRCTGVSENPGPPGSPPTYNYTLAIVPNQDQTQMNLQGSFNVSQALNLPVGFGQETVVTVGEEEPAPTADSAGTAPQSPAPAPASWGAGRG